MTKADRYAAAGVKLDTAEEAKRRIAELVRATRTPLARGKIGGFGGMVRVPDGYKKPVLVMSTDGVGSKVLVAAAAGVHDTVGEDLVNHSVNDILVHGATPLAFLDYIATGDLVPEIAAQIVTGVVRGCRAHDMTLAGGETAQLPDLYDPGHYDLAGAIIGIVEEDKARVPAPRIEARHVDDLEQLMDRLSESLPPLENFVLPGGASGAAALHLARTICRRAERLVVALSRHEAVGPHTISYLNRLSDALFVMARAENRRRGVPDILWNSRA